MRLNRVRLKARYFFPRASKSAKSARCFAVGFDRGRLSSGAGSIDLAQIGRQDIQFGPVFGDGSPSDDDAFFAHDLDHFLIG